MKKLTILLITFLVIYVIYVLFNVSRKINYVSISDSVMHNSFDNVIYDYLYNKKQINTYNNYFYNSTILKVYQDIKNNRTLKIDSEIYYLKKVLRESDVVVISVGMEELASNFDKYNYKSNYSFFNNMYYNIELLISEIKKYAYGKIIFLGYYNPTNYYDANVDRFFYDVNIKLERLMIDNNVIYLDLYELIKDNNYQEKNKAYLNKQANRKIAKMIEFYLT